MYAKLFTSIYQGTLRGNSRGLLVFTNLLAHADSAGHVDIHPRAIADEVGLAPDEVRAALDELEAPDVESRTPNEDGRRIVRLDDHRAWGWRIVNYAKYRAIKNEDDRREQNRLAQARWRAKQSGAQSASVSEHKHDKPESAQAEAEAEAEAINTEPTALDVSAAPNRPPACPTDKIVALYHKRLPMLPSVAVMTAARKRSLSARWREVVSADKMSAQEGEEFFDWFFSKAAESAFLTGRVEAQKGRRPFRATLDWLMSPTYFPRVVEGQYK